MIYLFQFILLMVVDLLCNIQEEQCSWVVCFLPQNGEATLIISSCLILLNKFHHKYNQFLYVIIFTGIYDFSIYLF